MRPSAVRALACALPLLAGARPGAAQEPRDSGWAGDFAVLSGNVLLGALSGGVVRKARGGSFSEGFARGAAGGAGVYAGKRIAVGRWAGAGLVGRQVASVGSSVVWNAGRGRGAFDEVALPLGPVRFYVRPRGLRVRARVDAVSLLSTAYAVARPELAWDARRSLSSGAMVFRAAEHEMSLGGGTVSGLAYPGNVFLAQARGVPDWAVAEVFAHERVHNLQADQSFFAVGRPVQEAALGRTRVGRALGRWVDLDLSVLGVAALAAAMEDHDRRPWEMEAYQLTGR